MNSDRPWMTALEMQFAALRRVTTDPAFKLERLASLLRRAETYAWSEDVASAMTAAAFTLPMSTELPLPYGDGAGFWWLQNGASDGSRANALLYGPDGDKEGFLSLTEFSVGFDGGIYPGRSFRWLEKSTIGHMGNLYRSRTDGLFDVEVDHCVSSFRLLTAGTAWLNQRVAVAEYGRIERHRRKQLARDYNVPIPGDVKVIRLRRAESSPHESNGEHGSVDWSCRWVVGGHWRNQRYKDEHKLIYIMPYVKGPEDKPVKIQKATVYLVDR